MEFFDDEGFRGDDEMAQALIPLVEEPGETVLLERTGDDRITAPIITSFEKAAILGQRTEDLQKGVDTPKIPLSVIVRENLDAKDIALLEYRQGKIPIIIKRNTQDGYFERWSVEELLDRDLGYSNI